MLVLINFSLIFPFFTGFNFYPDLYNRFTTNDPAILTYHTLWTTPLLLPIFFAVITFLFLTYVLPNFSTKQTILLLVGMFFYVAEISNVLTYNTSLTLQNPLSFTVNTLLLNSLNKYHPMLFYIAAAFTLIAAVKLNTANRPFLPLFLFTEIQGLGELNRVSTRLLTVALALGAWWAFQEGTWGGWWNWDSSEAFGYFILLSYLLNVHVSLKFFHCSRLTTLWQVTLIYVSIFYFVLQLSFDIVSHNFGAKFFFFFSSNLSLIFTTAILLNLTRKHYQKEQQLWYNYSNNCSEAKVYYPLTLFWGDLVYALPKVCLLIPAVFSLVPTGSYFVNQTLNYNLVNYDLPYWFLVGLFLLALAFFLRNDEKRHEKAPLALTTYSFNLYVPFSLLTIAGACSFTLVHILFIAALQINLADFNFPVSLMHQNRHITELDLSSSLLSLKTISLSCDHVLLQKSDLFKKNNFCQWNANWDLSLNASTFQANLYLLLFSHQAAYNLNQWTTEPLWSAYALETLRTPTILLIMTCLVMRGL